MEQYDVAKELDDVINRVIPLIDEVKEYVLESDDINVVMKLLYRLKRFEYNLNKVRTGRTDSRRRRQF